MQLKEYAVIVSEMINRLEPLHVLDYYCGNLELAKALRVNCAFKYQAYDPAIPKFASAPLPADVVVCVDALGKLDAEDAEEVLDELERLTEGVVFLVVADSERPPAWWLPRIMVRFDMQTYQVSGDNSFYVVGYARPRAIENEAGEKLS